MENLDEMFGLIHAIKIIDWKMKNNIARGGTGAGCKKLDASENECAWYTKDTL